VSKDELSGEFETRVRSTRGVHGDTREGLKPRDGCCATC
jgi:hypothetical protein